MLAKYIFSIIIVFFVNSALFAETTLETFASYPQKLKPVVETIQSLPEGRALIVAASKEGPIRLALFNDSRFGACWNNQERIIALDPQTNASMGKAINSLIFELHNAKNDKKLTQLYRLAANRQIDKEAFVESVERVEYENALETCRLLRKGIERKVFPKDADWQIFRSFEDHYSIQQMTGHSQQIAESYDDLTRARTSKPYIGTLGKYHKLSEKNKEDLVRYFYLKNDLQSPLEKERLQAQTDLEREYALVKRGLREGSATQRKRARDNLVLMDLVFKQA